MAIDQKVRISLTTDFFKSFRRYEIKVLPPTYVWACGCRLARVMLHTPVGSLEEISSYGATIDSPVRVKLNVWVVPVFGIQVYFGLCHECQTFYYFNKVDEDYRRFEQWRKLAR